MTKSKAQKRAKSGRKGLAGSVPQMVKAIKNRILSSAIGGVPKRKRKRKGKGSLPRGGVFGMNSADGLQFQQATDGISRMMSLKNNSNPVQPFNVRWEKIVDITGTTSAFAILQQFFLNPGNTVLFPIFSKEAATYEQYRVNVMRFHFVTSALSASGTNVSNGRLLMATNFDPDQGNFTTKNQMENYTRAESFAPFTDHVIHDVLEVSRKRKGDDFAVKNFYVNGSANQLTPVTGQAKFYDFGNFQFAGNGNIDATSQLGELWVEYSFTMINPLQETPLGDAIVMAKYLTTPVTAASRFLSGVQQAGSNMSLILAANTITIPVAGEFFCSLHFSAATSYTDVNVVSVSAGGTLLSILASNGVADNVAQSGDGSGSVSLTTTFFVSCIVPNVVITYAGTPTIAGTTRADLTVVQVPSDVITALKTDELSRLANLESMVKKLTLSRRWSESDFDEKEPECPRASAKLSDSVVDLITSKLRK